MIEMERKLLLRLAGRVSPLENLRSGDDIRLWIEFDVHRIAHNPVALSRQ
ncbi:MAG: hypothetical protein HW389_1691, partial [Bacteroidetes bacterium]|nr:hypothetical protein [Bacteroidota bacterium]